MGFFGSGGGWETRFGLGAHGHRLTAEDILVFEVISSDLDVGTSELAMLLIDLSDQAELGSNNGLN